MFELVQLEQLLAIKKYGTISKASEVLLISQPALSRSIQRLEDDLSVKLFERQKNKITFNENGEVALEYANEIINKSQEMESRLQFLERSRNIVSIGSCAPAPLWNLTPEISNILPDRTIMTKMEDENELIDGLVMGKYQIIILNKEKELPEIKCRKFQNEQLYISLPPAHPLAHRKELTLSDLNGQSVLIFSKIGFWFELCKQKMPDSLFLVQDELSALDELRRSSALPSFSTNITALELKNDNRVLIPLNDKEVNVTYYLLYNESDAKYYDRISSVKS